MLVGRGGNDCDEGCFLVHDGWDGRYVSVTDVREFCNVIDHLVCWFGIACNGCTLYLTLFGGVYFGAFW